MRRLFKFLAAAGLFSCASLASAQRFDLERLMLDPAAQGSLVVGMGQIGPAGQLRFSVAGHWERAPLVLLTSGDIRGRGIIHNGDLASEIVKDRLTLHVGVAFAVLDWIELHAMAPYIAWQDVPAGLPNAKKSALGTPSVGFKIGLLRQSDGAPFNAAVAADVLIPTKHQDALASSEDFAYTPRLEIGHRVGDVMVGGSAGVLVRTGGVYFGTTRLQHELLAGLGIATLGDPLRFELSARGAFNNKGLGQNVEALAGIRYMALPFEIFALGGPGFGDSPGTPTWRALFGVALNTNLAPSPPPAPPPPPPPPPPRDPCAAGEQHTPDQCPDLDDDGDGVSNQADKCALEKGPKENNGCPDTDRDNDGIPDRLDQCPEVAGVPEFNGCAAPAKAVLKQGKIEIKDKVYFNTGKATIQSRSYSLLDDVAQVMKAHPEVTKIVVEGHTDSRGSKAVNRRLSKARAEAVRLYLVEKGIDASRLEAQGFGPDRPAQTNKTAAGREANRRVEFVVAETAAK